MLRGRRPAPYATDRESVTQEKPGTIHISLSFGHIGECTQRMAE